MYSSSDAPQYRPGRHRLAHKPTRTLTTPRAAGFVIGAALTVLGVSVAHQALSTDPQGTFAAGPLPGGPGAAPSVPVQPPAIAPAAPDAPPPDSPVADTPSAGPRLLPQSTPAPQAQRITTTSGGSGGQSTSHASAPGSAAPAPAAPPAAAASPAPTRSSATTEQPAATPKSDPAPAPASSPQPSDSPQRPLSGVVGTVTGLLGGL